MKRQTIIASGSIDRMLQAAEAAWERGDFPVCIEMLQRASNLAPSNTGILLRLGRIHGLRYDYAAAELCFEQALRFAPKKIEMLTAIADQCENFRNPSIGEHYLRRAVEQPETTALACIKLAELCERLRRLPEAAELVERGLKLHPTFPAALLISARLERLAGRFESAEAVLHSFLTQPQPNSWVLVQAWYELATIQDRQAKYDEAMTAFLQAKDLLRPHASQLLTEAKLFRARLKIMESNISAEIIQRWINIAPKFTPPHRLALLCGYARSGTTLLEQVLDSHPDIVSSEESQVFLYDAFFPLKRRLPQETYMLPVLEGADVTALQQARTAYFRGMELSLGSPISGRLLVDKNPDYIRMIPAFVRIFPETKFLIALRDPRDVVMSCFMQAQPLNPATAEDLTLADATTRYVETMNLWRTLSPLISEHYLEIRYEDMVDSLESVAHKTLKFLGVPWDNRVLGFAEHAKKKLVRSPTYADVTQPVYKRAVGRWRNYQKYLEPHLEKLEPFVKAFGYE
jgi:tetratricopeptide (TPR) repeat protein